MSDWLNDIVLFSQSMRTHRRFNFSKSNSDSYSIYFIKSLIVYIASMCDITEKNLCNLAYNIVFPKMKFVFCFASRVILRY